MSQKKSWLSNLSEHTVHVVRTLGNLLGKLFDKVIYSNRASLIVSGLFALVFCVAISYDQLSFTLFHSDMNTFNLSSVPVDVLMNQDDYEVIGMPNTADLTIEGDAADIQLVKTQNSATVIADLRSMTEGKNTVILKASGLPSGLNVSVTPPSVEVELQHKYTVSFPVTADIMSGSGRKQTDFSAVLSVKNVTIRATNTKLKEVRSVKAIIDASRYYSDFSVQAPLVAYDASGKPMDVAIIPDSVEATVTVKNTKSYTTTSDGKDEDKTDAETGTSQAPAAVQPEESQTDENADGESELKANVAADENEASADQ